MWDYHEAGVVDSRAPEQALRLPDLPREGPYDSNHEQTIARHLSLAEQAGLDGLIVSWWGSGSRLNRPLRRMLDMATEHAIKLAVYYESSLAPSNTYFLVEDLTRLLDEYGAHPSYFKHNGTPVVFVYERAVRQYGPDQWRRAIDLLRRRRKALLIADTSSETVGRHFDGMHVYSPVAAIKRLRNMDTYYGRYVGKCRTLGRIACATVVPGFDDTGNGARRSWKCEVHRLLSRGKPFVLEREGGRTYQSLWESAAQASPDWVLVTSFNEWIEGTQIEPSVKAGDLYIRLTERNANHFKAGSTKREGQTNGKC